MRKVLFMGKNKKASKRRPEKSQTREEIYKSPEPKYVLIEQEALTEVIVKAYQRIEEQKRERENQEEEREAKAWQEALGKREYPQNEKWILRKIHSARNYIVTMWNMLFFKPENVSNLRTTYVLMRISVIGTFRLCEYVLYLFIMGIIFNLVTKEVFVPLGIVWALSSFLFARIFRIAAFEVEKIKDKNLLIAIFSGCISFVSVIIAVIAILVD